MKVGDIVKFVPPPGMPYSGWLMGQQGVGLIVGYPEYAPVGSKIFTMFCGETARERFEWHCLL